MRITTSDIELITRSFIAQDNDGKEYLPAENVDSASKILKYVYDECIEVVEVHDDKNCNNKIEIYRKLKDSKPLLKKCYVVR